MGDLDGLTLLSNLLALPKRLENASARRQDLSRYADTLTPAEMDAIAPEPGLSAINPTQHPGTYGKILAGVGGVGNVISSLLGQPLDAPRLDLSTISSLEGLRAKKSKEKALNTYADTLPDEGSKALARAGYPASAAKGSGGGGGKLGTGVLGQYIQEGLDNDMTLLEARKWGIKQYEASRTNQALATGKGMSPVLAERGQTAAETEVSKQVRLDAMKQLRQIGDIEERVMPMMDLAQKALSSSPTFAATVQPAYLWARALGGDEAANAMQQLPTQIPSLARLSDTGNLSEPEQAVWKVFLSGGNMTAQQFALTKVALEKILGSVALRAHKAYTTGEIELPKSLTKKKPDKTDGSTAQTPAAGGAATGGDELDQLLKAHGH